jgi:cytochrome c553
MKKINSILFGLFIVSSSLLVVYSCEKEEACDEDNISEQGDDDSHNMGQNCMQCHKLGGEGEGCFVVAGTVYDTLSTNTLTSGKIELFTGPDGTGNLVHTIQVDSKGNFYTTENFDITGLYPVLTGPSGNKSYMGSSLTSGQCNSCHGATTSRITGY